MGWRRLRSRGTSRVYTSYRLGLTIFKLGDLSVIFAKRFNIIIEGDGAASVRIPLVKGCYLGTIVNIISKAV